MTKKTFVKKLTSKLEILDTKELIKIIKKYETDIEKRIADGVDEKDAVSELGSVDDLARKILRDHKISEKYIGKEEKEDTKEDRLENTIEKVANEFVKMVEGFAKKISEQDSNKIIEIIIYILIVIFAFWLLKIPFWFIETLGIGLLGVLRAPLSIALIGLWSFILDIAYLVLVIYAIILVLNRVTKSEYRGSEVVSKVTNKVNEIKEDVKEEVKRERYAEKSDAGSVIMRTISIIIKISIILLIMPLFFTQFGLLITLGVLIALAIKGALLVGPILVIIALMTLVGAITGLILDITFKRRGIR